MAINVMTLLPKIFIALCFMIFAGFGHCEESAKPAVTDYIALEPAFVTHLGPPGSKLAYLKTSVSLRASATSTRPVVETHMPRIRHELVMLFGEQTDVDALAEPDSRQALANAAKDRVNQVLENQRTGETIAGVLFTEFVVQK